ncbi:hypothetical protein C8J57DRAFT_1521939 [Mycena rebaudengoi]|nr:hypothetical protein C8J57DRAFT_1521939 [Mycena rebaudengoi]
MRLVNAKRWYFDPLLECGIFVFIGVLIALMVRGSEVFFRRTHLRQRTWIFRRIPRILATHIEQGGLDYRGDTPKENEPAIQVSGCIDPP